MKGLTERQQEIALFIEQYFDENGYAPSLRDIGNQIGRASCRERVSVAV